MITRRDKVTDEMRKAIPIAEQNDRLLAHLVRMAALCHDIGHLPFSHAAEDELLPDGVDHELITWKIVHSDAIAEIFNRITPPVRPMMLPSSPWGPGRAMKLRVGFSSWEAILAEIIVGDFFGADRMDYLLRDSLHAGVQYGRFDHERLDQHAEGDARAGARGGRDRRRGHRTGARLRARRACSQRSRCCSLATSCSARSTITTLAWPTTSISRIS